MRLLLHLPLTVILMGIGALAMYVPAAHGLAIDDHRSSRIFFYYGTLFLILTAVIGLATSRAERGPTARNHLLALLAAFTVLPLMLAAPVNEIVRDTPYLNAWFEMVSSLTTTGATLFDQPERLPQSVHLWRALIGWLGGFLMWVAAIAILAPMNLGGFEVITVHQPGRTGPGLSQAQDETEPGERLIRYALRLFPVYAGLTLVLWVALLIAGGLPFNSFCHAMSTLATSSISPVGGIAGGQAGFAGEVLVFLFMFFAVSRQTFSTDLYQKAARHLTQDREFRIALALVIFVPLLLFLRHWIAAFEIQEQENLLAALRALWGSVFTVLSFLTTNGYVSEDWAAARAWSGLEAPGMILVGLALTGGGVATTAGGIKLLRVYALFKHGTREMQKLVHPNSVGGKGPLARHIRRQGAYIAWIFFMLFLLSMAAITLALSLTGIGFESALLLTVAALSTTGPVASIAAADPISFAALGDTAKVILALAMALGRLEALAIIALLNPDFWRN